VRHRIMPLPVLLPTSLTRYSEQIGQTQVRQDRTRDPKQPASWLPVCGRVAKSPILPVSLRRVPGSARRRLESGWTTRSPMSVRRQTPHARRLARNLSLVTAFSMLTGAFIAGVAAKIGERKHLHLDTNTSRGNELRVRPPNESEREADAALPEVHDDGNRGV
jgi:hypothetical protein